MRNNYDNNNANNNNNNSIKGHLTSFNRHADVNCGPGSSVGIATDDGLDGPGSNSGGDEIFRPSRPALGITQPSVQWVPGLSPGQSAAGGVLLTTDPF